MSPGPSASSPRSVSCRGHVPKASSVSGVRMATGCWPRKAFRVRWFRSSSYGPFQQVTVHAVSFGVGNSPCHPTPIAVGPVEPHLKPWTQVLGVSKAQSSGPGRPEADFRPGVRSTAQGTVSTQEGRDRKLHSRDRPFRAPQGRSSELGVTPQHQRAPCCSHQVLEHSLGGLFYPFFLMS